MAVRAIILPSLLLLLVATMIMRNRTNPIFITRNIVFSNIYIFWSLLTLIGGASILSAANPSEAVVEFSRILLIFILSFVSALILHNDEVLFNYIPRLTLLTTIILSLIAIAQRFIPSFTYIPGVVEPYATLTHRNQLAIYLTLAAPYTILALFNSRRLQRLCVWAALVLSLYVIVISTCRAAWAAGIVSGLLTYLLMRKSKTRQTESKRRQNYWKTGLIAGGIAIIIAVASITADVQIRTGDSQRLMLWRKTLRMTAEHPITGVGLGNWRINIPLFVDESDPAELAAGELRFQRPHNDFLWNLSEMGIIGLLAYLGLFISILITGVKAIRHNKDGVIKRLIAVCIAASLAYMIAALFDFPREKIEHNVLFALAAGGIAALAAAKSSAQKHHRSPFAPLVFIMLIVGGFGLWIGVSRFRAEVSAKSALAAAGNGAWREALASLNSISSPFYTVDYAGTPIDFVKGLAHINLGDENIALRCFTTALQYNPNHLQTQVNLGSCYERKGDHRLAQIHYLQALRISPHNEEVLLNLAASHCNAGDVEDALRALESVNPNTTNPRYKNYLEVIRRMQNEQDTCGRHNAAECGGAAGQSSLGLN